MFGFLDGIGLMDYLFWAGFFFSLGLLYGRFKFCWWFVGFGIGVVFCVCGVVIGIGFSLLCV